MFRIDLISASDRGSMFVVRWTVQGRMNRFGRPYVMSRTFHVRKPGEDC